MARLSAEQRKKLRKADFVYPESRSYPIPDENHAKAAIFMAARKDTKGDLKTVKRAVKKKFPKLGTGKG